MSHLWSLTLVAAGFIFAAGAFMWLDTATAMVRVVVPSRNWLAKEANLNTWGARLMTVGAVLAVLAVTFAGWR